MKNTNLIIGKKGIGKTSVMFDEIKKLIENEENLLIIDNKEEYYKTYGEELNNKGYKINVINFKDSTKSNGFNPLYMPYKLYKSGNKDTAIRIIDNFSKSLMHKQEVMDPFWTDSAASYLTGLIILLFKEAKEEEINLASIQVMISQIEKDLTKVREYVNNLDLISPEYTYLSTTINAPNETRGGIVSVLKMELTKYISTENLLNLLCTNEIDLTKDEKNAIFVIGNEDYNKLTNVVISEVINSNIKYSYILDNFDSLDKILGLGDLLETNNKVYIVSRNKENITDKYGKYILDKFDNIENIEEENKLIVGNYNVYPTIDKQDKKYFNLNGIL
ncbi:MAG: type IV secretory system conjugative DNA transfer family protein [Bacilli bacterium]|nr:type IV secretory system conjugative DNA transfer family protein [Bacilli bacterium]